MLNATLVQEPIEASPAARAVLRGSTPRWVFLAQLGNIVEPQYNSTAAVLIVDSEREEEIGLGRSYEEAPLVAAWYVGCVSEAYVLKDSHGVGALLGKAESYRAQWARGQALTGTAAQAADKTSANFDAIEEAKRLRRQRGGRGNGEGGNA